MTDLSKNELAYALLRSIEHLDARPADLKYGDTRTETERDEGRRICGHILALVPDMGELADMAVRLWVTSCPSTLRNDHLSYHGPDVFRSCEHYNSFPDDSGVDPNDEDAEIVTWADRAGLSDTEDRFLDKALLCLQRHREQAKARKRAAAADKRREKVMAKHKEEREAARLSAAVRGIMAAATAPSSDAQH